jgi:DNA-binding response OmpR family regulator
MKEREKRILVVDDDYAIRALLFTVMRRRGFLVDAANDGAAALERLDHCRYAILLLDLMMPRINGWQVLEELTERPPQERPLVIVLTAGTEPRTFPPDLVAATIRKPFDVELLVDTVSACLTTLRDCEQPPNCPEPESTREGRGPSEESPKC